MDVARLKQGMKAITGHASDNASVSVIRCQVTLSEFSSLVSVHSTVFIGRKKTGIILIVSSEEEIQQWMRVRRNAATLFNQAQMARHSKTVIKDFVISSPLKSV